MTSFDMSGTCFARVAALISERAAPVCKRGGHSRAKGVCHGLVAYPLNTPVRVRRRSQEKTQETVFAPRGAFSGSEDELPWLQKEGGGICMWGRSLYVKGVLGWGGRAQRAAKMSVMLEDLLLFCR